MGDKPHSRNSCSGRMAKTVLFVGGGIESVPGIALAAEMGHRIVVSDYDSRAPGFAIADDRLLVSTYDVGATVRAAAEFSASRGAIDGVLCLGTDVPVTVAAVADELGLPGIPLESARLAADKLAMKCRFHRDAVPIPWFAPVASNEDLAAFAAAREAALVIKPVDSRGARGVLRLTPDVDLSWAFETARANSPTGRVMIEEFLPGPQISTESIVIDGQACTPGFADRNYEFLERYAPHIIENGGELPSWLPESTQDAVRELVQQAAASMGIRNGVVKGDIVVSDGRPYVIELAARLSGGYFCTHEIPLNTGVEIVRHALRQALGEPVAPDDLAPSRKCGVAQRYIFPEPGTVTEVRGVDEVRSRPEIAFCDIRVRPSDAVPAMTAHPARAGVVIATGLTREDAIDSAEDAVGHIEIHTARP